MRKGEQLARAAILLGLTGAAHGQQIVDRSSAGSAGIALPQVESKSADYARVTRELSSVANFNVETRRGVVAYPGPGQQVWAINTHASTLNLYVGLQPEPVERFPTLVNPVSVALYADDLWVVGAGTRALVRHDRSNGAIIAHCDLPSEPFDIVFDADLNRAFVSCMGEGIVVEIDVATMDIVDRHTIAGRRAAFLFFDPGDPLDPADNQVFVAPNLSGNNSIAAGTPVTILDGEDPALFPAGGLADTDLVSIATRTGAQTIRGRDQGTLLFGHGRNPVTGQYWLLNIESINKDPEKQSEPDLKGVFAENRISITDLAAVSGPAAPGQIVSLDSTGAPGDPTTAGMPTQLEFDPASGGAWIVSPTNDLVAFVDSTGTRQPALDIALPTGSIPREFVRTPTGNAALVYAWGSNEVFLLSLSPADYGNVLVSYDLGEDPLPAFLRAGREIFYDAHRSANARTTCAHCHVGGGSDALGWSISDRPVDEKGVMVTQSLIGIADTFPHHWRGERDLAAFNAAFEGLLGGAQLDPSPGAELDQFIAFVHSLKSHANPRQHVSRRLVDAQTPEPIEGGAPGSAVFGQETFLDTPLDPGVSCVTCHALPTGSSGNTLNFFANPNPFQMHFETCSLDNAATFKHQQVVSVVTANGTRPVSELGFGVLHHGLNASIFSTLDQNFPMLSDKERRGLTAFLHQFDTGTSPAEQRAYRVADITPTGLTQALTGIETVLLDQARRGWIDVIAFGSDAFAGASEQRSWWWDPAVESFVGEDPATAPMPWTTVKALATNGAIDWLVLGVPLGNGQRLGIDRDDDGLPNGAELALGLDPFRADTDLDGFLDGYEALHGSDPLSASETPSESDPPSITSVELDFVNARLAKFHWTTDEACSVVVDYGTPNGQSYQWRSPTFETRRTTVLTFDESSFLTPNVFTATATLTDASGNATTVPFASFGAGALITVTQPTTYQVQDLAFTQVTRMAGGLLRAYADVTVKIKAAPLPKPPAADVVVIAQVLLWDDAQERFTIASGVQTTLPTSFVLDPAGQAPYTALPGPFLVLPPTDVAGVASLDFGIAGLSAGQRIKLNIVAIQAAGPGYDPLQPVFLDALLDDYQMPTTRPEHRSIDLVY